MSKSLAATVGREWDSGEQIEFTEEKCSIEDVHPRITKGSYIEVRLRIPYDDPTMTALSRMYVQKGKVDVRFFYTVPDILPDDPYAEDEKNQHEMFTPERETDGQVEPPKEAGSGKPRKK